MPTSIEPTRSSMPSWIGRVQGDQLQRLDLAHAAPLHRLGGLLVEVAHLLAAVGVDRHQHAALGHQRGVVGDGVVGLDLVAPPVGEGRGAGAVGGDLVGHLVALEHVLQRRDPEAELLGQAHQLQDLVGPVAVRVHQALALEDLDQRLELQVAPRLGGAVAGRRSRLVGVPLLAGTPRASTNACADHVHRRPCGSAGSAAHAGTAEVGALGVLAQGELDARRRALELACPRRRRPSAA